MLYAICNRDPEPRAEECEDCGERFLGRDVEGHMVETSTGWTCRGGHKRHALPAIDNDPAGLWICDNGAVLCYGHLGHTAKATGHDLSGQPVLRVTDDDRAEWQAEFHVEIVCECCAAAARR